MLIADIYHKSFITIDHSARIAEALALCIKHHINGLIVVDDKNHVVGVLSVQDIAAATIPSQFRQNPDMAAAMYTRGFFHQMCREVAKKSVSTIMRRKFESVGLDDNIMSVTADFLKNDLYILPVIEKKQLIGIITRSQIKSALARGMEI